MDLKFATGEWSKGCAWWGSGRYHSGHSLFLPIHLCDLRIRVSEATSPRLPPARTVSSASPIYHRVAVACDRARDSFDGTKRKDPRKGIAARKESKIFRSSSKETSQRNPSKLPAAAVAPSIVVQLHHPATFHSPAYVNPLLPMSTT
uniref:Uncharacterized protein n=1 Tax=Vespula pensylvanica TaxID=30213 RepID=A0A834P173_VESPE|nr:hypothetical protein H0235_009178 [Vespula pensylvanica]